MSQDQNLYRSSLVDQFVEKAHREYIPLFTTIELTLNCNLKCAHCYNFDRSGRMPENLSSATMKKEEILKAIDEVAMAGAFWLNFSGGEALLHPDLGEFIKRAKSHHCLVKLKTNGILLNQKKAQELYDLGLDGVDVSLYGAREETYESFAGVKGLFKALEGLSSARKVGLDTYASLILHRDNVDEVEQMIRLVEERDIPYQISDEITDRYDESMGARKFEISAKQYEKLLLEKEGHRFMHRNVDRALQCGCARLVCGINSLGEVLPCVGAPIPSGNLKSQSFADIWKNSSELKKIRELKREDFKECGGCEYIEFCNRSSGAIFVNTGHYTGCDSQTLDRAKIRYQHKGHFLL